MKVLNAVTVLPCWDDNQFSKVKEWRRTDQLGCAAQRWREISHDPSYNGVSQYLESLVMWERSEGPW